MGAGLKSSFDVPTVAEATSQPERCIAPPLDDAPAIWLNRESVRAWAAGRRMQGLVWGSSGGWEIDVEFDIYRRPVPSTMPLAELVMLYTEAWLLAIASAGYTFDLEENPPPDSDELARAIMARRVAVPDRAAVGLHRVRRKGTKPPVEMKGQCKRCGADKPRKNLYCVDCTKAVRAEIRGR